MRNVELKIPREGSSRQPKTCLVFHYCAVRDLGPRPLNAAELGFEVLSRIAVELRTNSFEVSDPATGKKSFGITWIKCRVGNQELGISAWPPDGDDEWQVRATWLPRSEHLGEMTQAELAAWEAIQPILNYAVAKLLGTTNLRWFSHHEVLDAERSHVRLPDSLRRSS